MKNFSEKVRSALSRMTIPGDKVVTAVSGGPDSVALLHVLHEMQDEFELELCIAHLDHMARGKESDEDARFVERLGQKLGLRTFIERLDVSREKESLKTSFQEAARTLRYRFLLSLMERVEGARLALGHHADDQVETILINLLRGSGMKGLSGMPETRGAVIRPLIDCTRAEIDDYLQTRGLECRQDSSNASDKYLRNRIRQDLVPVLKKFNENFSANLLQTARIIRDDDRCLDDQTDRLYAEMVIPTNKGQAIEIDREKFLHQSPGFQKRLVRKTIVNIQGNLRRISIGHVNQVIDLFRFIESGKRINLPGALIAISRENGVEFQIEADPFLKDPLEPLSSTELVIPGATEIGRTGIRLQSRLISSGNWVDREKSRNRAFLDFDVTGEGIQGPLFQAGGPVCPAGHAGPEKTEILFYR